MLKTNVMRLLEKNGIRYEAFSYPCGEDHIDGKSIASLIDRDADQVFKTLVARGSDENCHVFVLPVSEELDLKKAAAAAGIKSISMLHLNELTPMTGYIRGGCSPIGMKKAYPTCIDESAQLFDTILVSAGKIGYQVELAPEDLAALTGASFADLTV